MERILEHEGEAETPPVPQTRRQTTLEDVWGKKKEYPSNLPSSRIVICFHNEEFNVLFWTVSSVMTVTPQYILEEIILVDDMREFDDLKEKLDYHVENFRGKIKLIRNKKREGLIRARLIGASRASGDVLMLLDSHCKVTKVWLEPVLNAIAKDPQMGVCPLIDASDYVTLEYQSSPVVRGAFNWYLQFKRDRDFSYEMDGPEGPTRPIWSPAMTGGSCAINRHYFNAVGKYKGINLWGGEHLELSLRTWMYGGQLFTLPCSRVGHIDKQHFANHTGIVKALVYNNLRLVHIWLDEYTVKDTSLVWIGSQKDGFAYGPSAATQRCQLTAAQVMAPITRASPHACCRGFQTGCVRTVLGNY
ncbi:inactive polypeptide N-acetylgalactosaminyltransferase-like protein 5 [Delphinus delphis]|uniref:inactive polypeptide N-acetylgalactosaminyltransferase-like protein 5 n=1 Tax=Delphinus delphis TaxID=9728 RepID=UPI00375190DE